MDGTIFFTIKEVNCTSDFMLATYQASDGVRLTVYALAAVQGAVLLIGSVLNCACLATLLRFPLSSEVNGHFVSFALCDTVFLLFNLLDTISHCIENSGPLTNGPEPFRYIVYAHPIVWTIRSVAYTVHCWQTVLLSALKCHRIAQPLSAMSDSRLDLMIALVWLYSLASSIPPVLLFQAFVSVLFADCPGEGYRIAGSGYYAYYSGNRTGSVEATADTIPPTFVAVNSSLLPACICLICSLIIVAQLRRRAGSRSGAGSTFSGGQLSNMEEHQRQHHHHLHHHRNSEAAIVRQGREATRAVLLSVNSFLIFQIPMVMWTLVDRWFWPALQPSTFSLLVVITNTVSQLFFAGDLAVCLHSNHRFRANFRRFLLPIGFGGKGNEPGGPWRFHRHHQDRQHHQQQPGQPEPGGPRNRIDTSTSSEYLHTTLMVAMQQQQEDAGQA